MKNKKFTFVCAAIALAFLPLFVVESSAKAEPGPKSSCRIVVEKTSDYKEIRECCVFESGTLIYQSPGVINPIAVLRHACSAERPFGWNEIPPTPQPTPAPTPTGSK